MNAAREDVCQRSVAGRHAAHQKRLRTLLGLLLTATFVLPEANALAQSSPIMPKISIGGEQKRALTPEEQERQKPDRRRLQGGEQQDPDSESARSLGRCAAGACWLRTESFGVYAKRLCAKKEAIGATTAITVKSLRGDVV
jgi:hypothetical protein